MGNWTAESYVRALCESILDAQVTDRLGMTLSLDDGADRAVQMLLNVRRRSRKVMLVGNGGSAAVVSHMQNDIVKAVGFRAMVFTEQPLLTALANDEGYERVYEQPVGVWGESEDLLIAVSSSGRSNNILRAAAAAVNRGCDLVTFSGFEPDNPLRSMGDLNFYVSSNIYGHVETAHAALTHFLTDQAAIVTQRPAQANRS